MKFVKFLDELGKNSLLEAGTKGANLAEMYNIGLPTPNAFVVTSNAYKYFLEKTQIKVAIFDILKYTDINDSNQLQKNAKKIRKMIEEVKIPYKIKKEIISAYKKLSKEFKKNYEWVAVRSSATIEDLSGAGSILNVKGEEKVIASVKRCWSSLFTPKSIFYRKTKGISHKKVLIAVAVQKQLNSEKAGLGFTVDPSSGNMNQIIVESTWGQCQGITSGAVTPDKYILDKRTGNVIEKRINKKTEMRILDSKRGGLISKKVPKDKQKEQTLDDYELTQIYNLALKLEEHYKAPQDFEWVIEDENLYLVQSRPINVIYKSEEGENVNTTKKPVLKGIPASPGVISGKVRIIKNSSELSKINKGDILVAKMTNPDYVPAMKKISAIITDEGGQTSHISVVARELGVPCIVGTKEATKRLKNGDDVTIDGDDGFVYLGKFYSKAKKKIKYKHIKTKTKIYMNLGEPDLAKKYKNVRCDGIGLFRAEFMVAGLGEHPNSLIEKDGGEKFVEVFSDGIEKVAKTFYPRPIVYRALDFKTNEYANLKGGKKYEPKENNPMIGWRGASRYVTDPMLFKLELEAIKKVKSKGYNNVWLMIPFVRTSWELRHIRMLIRKAGLLGDSRFKLWIMVEVPSSAILIEEFIKEGVDGVSIGSNDLTQLTLGVDRDSSTLNKRWFYELDPAVLWCIKRVVKTCKKYNVTSSICGQAPSFYPELTKKLVKWGITSVSVNPDVVDKTRRIVADAEKGVVRKIFRK
ncbi:MAG: phosphoenolpyruvate synthase [Candidatus Aenigmarchaeota archaeon]|nr:phosphoenolpyruvate synthase [Candidatus Aenigmarchaeota archaeon]